ncbi:MAG: metallophosphoesterase [Myxococcales bacterium]|nr:metallophosphoesterase [Myxococcales bacterium]
MGRTIFVGDIHGCAAEFGDLLDALKFAQGVDRVLLVGDLVARGPDSAGVIALAQSVGAKAVRGNHDEKVLSWWRVAQTSGRREANRRVKLSERHQQVAAQCSEPQLAFLATLPLMMSLPEHNVLMVHAGVDPSIPTAANVEEVLLTVRSIDEQGKVTRRLTGLPWAAGWRGPQQIVFGHDARRNLQLEAFATGLDTGCCYGRQLSALVLDAGEPMPTAPEARRARVAQVAARAVWCPMGSGDGPE